MRIFIYIVGCFKIFLILAYTSHFICYLGLLAYTSPLCVFSWLTLAYTSQSIACVLVAYTRLHQFFVSRGLHPHTPFFCEYVCRLEFTVSQL